MLSKRYESTEVDRRTWLHVPSGTHWSTSSDTHQVVEIQIETSTKMYTPFLIGLKDYFGLKCILSYFVPVQTIVSPYDANCVTPLIYPPTDLDFLFGIIVSFDLSFYFFETCTQPFCKRHYPVIVITITRHVLYTGKNVHVCIF